MAINGIGAFLNYSLNRNYSNYYSTVNQIRLQQALEKNGYGGSNVERVSSKYNNLWSNYKAVSYTHLTRRQTHRYLLWPSRLAYG